MNKKQENITGWKLGNNFKDVYQKSQKNRTEVQDTIKQKNFLQFSPQNQDQKSSISLEELTKKQYREEEEKQQILKQFEDILEAELNMFIKDDSKEHIYFPREYDLEWKQLAYSKGEEKGLEFNSEMRKEKKLCILWKKNSNYGLKYAESRFNDEEEEKEEEQEECKQNQNNYKLVDYENFALQIPPDPVQKIIFKEQIKTQLKIQFCIPNCNGEAIIKYKLQYKISGKVKQFTNWFEIQETEDTQQIREKNIDLDISKLIDDIEKQQGLSLNMQKTIVEVRLTSFNKFGESKPQLEITKFIMPENKQYFLFMSGNATQQQIPIDSQFVPDNAKSFNENTFCYEKFSEVLLAKKGVPVFQQVTVNSCLSLAKIQNGKCANWGSILFDEDDEKAEYTTEQLQNVEAFQSQPFSPIDDQLNIIVNSVSCGVQFCGISTINGQVYTWGSNMCGQLGHNDLISRTYPKQVEYFSSNNIFVTQVQCGANHMIAQTEKERVYSWGYQQGREGVPICDRQGKIQNLISNGSCCKIPHIQDVIFNCTKISAYGNSSMALTQDKKMYCWGDNNLNQLGIQQSIYNIVLASALNNERFSYINADLGLHHGVAVAEDKQNNNNQVLLVWGCNKYGQLGIKDSKLDNFQIPIINEFFNNKKIIEVSAGAFHTLVLCDIHENDEQQNQGKTQRKLYGFGKAKQGEFGILQEKKYQFTPLDLTQYLPKDVIVEHITAGYQNTALLVSQHNQ